MLYSFQHFYDRFGVTPDTVGLTPTTIVSKSALGALKFLALYAIAPVALGYLAFLALGRWKWLRRRVHWPILRLVTAILAAFLTVEAAQWSTHGSFVVLPSLVVVTCVLTCAHWGFLDYGARETHSKKFLRVGLAWTASVGLTVWLVVAAAAATGLEMAESLPHDASAAANCAIRRYLPVRAIHTHRHILGWPRWPVLSVEVDRATVEWVGSKRAPSSFSEDDRFLFLGQTNGLDILYDDSNASRLTLELPAADVALTIHREDTHCHPWEKAPPTRRPGQ